MKNPKTIFNRRATFAATSVHAWSFSAALALVSFLFVSVAFAGSAMWTAANGNWNLATNWNPNTVPNASTDTATFYRSGITAVSLSATVVLADMVFNGDGYLSYTITIPGQLFDFEGAGITNNSGLTQNFVCNGNGNIEFFNSASAGSLTKFTVNNGVIYFFGSSNAGSATFTNNPGTIAFTEGATAGTSSITSKAGSQTQFFVNATADGASLTASSAVSSPALILFAGNSSGGTSRINLVGSNAQLEIDGHSAPGLTVGSIKGNGRVILGANNLTVGSNNLGTTFSGIIEDGTYRSGGQLSKTGKGTFTLSGANTYTGGTAVSGGTLLVKNQTGSATGTGAVQVNSGTLCGIGSISGAVTIGNGSSKGTLSPGTAAAPGNLTINSMLTFAAPSTYKWVLNRTTLTAGKITALGVIINNATLTFAPVGSGTLAHGTSFTVIDNISANPIVGTFANLPDGEILTSGGITVQANYHGGTGNDLTLTVQ
jgi:autotransporter-associated beta strand protein